LARPPLYRKLKQYHLEAKEVRSKKGVRTTSKNKKQEATLPRLYLEFLTRNLDLKSQPQLLASTSAFFTSNQNGAIIGMDSRLFYLPGTPITIKFSMR
jgi:hypothetical protein